MNKPTTLMRLVIAWFVFAGQAWAQSDATGIPWDQLSPTEQRILAPLQESWDQLPADRQYRMQKGAKRWADMTPQQRQHAQQRLQRWKRLDPQQKERIRKRFDRFKQLPREKRQALRQKRKWFKSLPAERRHELRKQWRNLTPTERHRIQRELGIIKPHRQQQVPAPIDRPPRDVGRQRPREPAPDVLKRPRREPPAHRRR